MKSPRVFFILLTAFLCLNSCDRGPTIDQDIAGEGNREYKEISISCAPCLQSIMSAWMEDFNSSHPMIRVTSSDSNADFILVPEDQLNKSDDPDTWRAPVMREGIIPIISARNPFLEILEEQGVSKDKLVRIFTGDRISWGEVLGTDAAEQIVVYLPEKGKGHNQKWAEFLEISPGSLQGKRYADKETLLLAIKNDPYSIAVLNACCAYDPKTNEPVDGITALSIDINNDGMVDRKENISDELCEVERDFYLGLHPSKLCMCIFLQSDEMPATEEQFVFIKWILTQGQQHVADHGYSVIRHAAAKKIIQTLEVRVQ